MLTLELMQQMWPRGNSDVPGLIEGIVAAAPRVFPKFGLNDNLTIAHAMAQFSHECGAGLDMIENIRYTPARACEVWPSRFSSPADCLAKVGSFQGDPDFPIKLIDNVYGNRMGNRPGTHDGSRFIGRGLSQCTGRHGYERLSRATGIPELVDSPDLVTKPENALECGVADFVACGCLPFAKNDDVRGVTQHLNGGFVGLNDRIAWLARWKAALGSANPAPRSTTWLQISLNKLGAEPDLVPDGEFGPLTAAALKTFQQQNGLPADGRVSEETFKAIEEALRA